MTLVNFLTNKVIVYTALNNEDHRKVSQAFKKAGIKFKAIRSNRPNTYDFYVKKQQKTKAQKTLSQTVFQLSWTFLLS